MNQRAYDIFEACMRLEALHGLRREVKINLSDSYLNLRDRAEFEAELAGYLEEIYLTENHILEMDKDLKVISRDYPDAVKMKRPDYEDWFCQLRDDLDTKNFAKI